jgi:hypothetical protein
VIVAIGRRATLLGLASAGLVGPAGATSGTMHVLKTATCSCCAVWIKHVRLAGFAVTAKDVSAAELTKFKLDGGIRPQLAACHTGQVAGYLIEGHVPAPDIQRLLRQRPDAIGLAVPGMPIGSPGMESGSTVEAYDVLLVKFDGSTEVFARYAARTG